MENITPAKDVTTHILPGTGDCFQHHFRGKSKTYTECNEKDHLILGQFQAPQETNAQFNIPTVDCTQEKPIKV